MSNGYFKVEMPKNEPVKSISSRKPGESQLKERTGAPVRTGCSGSNDHRW